MKKPILLIMAAGMGSRYGGLKQMDPMDDEGHLIIDFSLYDAHLAGFDEVIFIIKRENEAMFREKIGSRVEKYMTVHYVFQELTDLPEGFSVPEGRVKPWGTGHAVLSAIYTVNDASFAVINADDYYGRQAFRLLFDYLVKIQKQPEDGKYRFAMVGYEVGKTVTEHGTVARGVCKTDENGYLTEITERTKIVKRGPDAAYSEDDGKTWVSLPGNTPVSMNFWGFSSRMLDELQKRFPEFLKEQMKKDPLKGEYFLPFVVEELIRENKAEVKVLRTPDRWYGVTYREDRDQVVAAMKQKEADGEYPAGFGFIS